MVAVQGTYDDHRFSPLKQINEENVGKLGLACSRELGTTRGLEATPLVEDGIPFSVTIYARHSETSELMEPYSGPSREECI